MPGVDTITAMIEDIALFRENLEEGIYCESAILENEKIILDMNVDQLNISGINSLGVSINSYAPYTPVTIEIKRKKGQPYDRVTLRDTGAFHKGFIIKADREGFSITSTDGKTEELETRYGEEIFGLTDDNMGKLLSKIKEYIIKERDKLITTNG